ncbi:MAG: hypothetical protein ACYS8Z_10800 [Planctomycetota bacterium]|jgi:hypothetical protein
MTGLEIQSQNVKGKDLYTVRVRIVNTSNEPITLIGFAPYEGKLNTYAEWLRAEVIFMTFPELIPPSAQTAGMERTSPHPKTAIDVGKEFAVSWKSSGRYLKTDYYYNTTPYFPSDGLYGVRARITLRTAKGEEIHLYSNEQAVSVGGTVALPKHGLAYVVQRDEEKREVVLSLGSRHRIAKGDRFHIMGRFPSGWMMTVTEVDTVTCRASVRITGDPKDMGLLPPKHAKAQLWEFGQAEASSQSPDAPELTAIIRDLSVPDLKAICVGMTRKELNEICHIDGGISTVSRTRYVLNDQHADAPEGKVLKVYVSLRPADLGREVYADAERFRKWRREHGAHYSDTNIVMAVSAPFWEPPYFD